MKALFISLLFFMVCIPVLAGAQNGDDIMPVKTPNVMIIFDTSSSMGNGWDGKGVSWGNAVGEDGQTHTFMGAGSHPNSKLYQAKKAMKEVIQDVIQDKVNLGFSTYAQRRNEYRWCYYISPAYTQLQKLYFAYYQRRWEGWSYSTSSSSFMDVRDQVQTAPGGRDFVIGDKFKVIGPFNKHKNQIFKEVTMPPNPVPPVGSTDGADDPNFHLNPSFIWVEITDIVPLNETHQFLFKYKSIEPGGSPKYYWFYHEQMEGLNRTSCGSDKKNDPFPPDNSTLSGYVYTLPEGAINYWNYARDKNGDMVYSKTYFSDDIGAKLTEYNTGRWKCKEISYDAGKQSQWYRVNGTSCTPTDPYGQGWVWDPSKGSDDCSDYLYPADGTGDYPHMWSYFKTNPSEDNLQTPPWRVLPTWSEGLQTNLYPSSTSFSPFNDKPGTGNNHIFFVNIPDDKDSGPPSPLERRKAAKERILSYMDLTPVESKHSYWAGYWSSKLPLHGDYGLTGLSEVTYEPNGDEKAYTPLADSLKSAGKYFQDYICNYKGGDAASKMTPEGFLCRGNYVLLITDGLESARLKPDSNGKLVGDYDAAPGEASNLLGLQCGGETAPVKTFVIALGVDSEGLKALNGIASSGGTGHAYSAKSMDELKTQLRQIFSMIISAYLGRSNPVVSRERDRVYKGFYEVTPSGEWKGHLTAWDVKTNGDLNDAATWDAGSVMQSNGRGSVYTWTASGPNPPRLNFCTSFFGLSCSSLLWSDSPPPVNRSNEEINGSPPAGPGDSDDAKAIINFTLDPNYDGGKYKGKRAVDWKLGDIYHSTPVVVGPPAYSFTEKDYKGFYDLYKGRERMVYVGANDGMLHAFKGKAKSGTDGSEVFSIIPENLLGKVKDLRNTHGFYVDSSPRIYDVYFPSLSGSDREKWRTVLISGERAGGPYYFAVDVTDPSSAPKILWEWGGDAEPGMGEAWAKPEVGKVKVTDPIGGLVIKPAAFITGGYSASPGKSNSFHVVDIETGNTLFRCAGLGSGANKIPSGATVFDANGDGIVDYVYFGDTDGTLWRADLTNPDPASWIPVQLYIPAIGRPIFYPPAVTKNDDGKILVYFGTGNEMDLSATENPNYLYEVEDQGGTGKKNWVKELPGQKVLASPVVANYIVYFTTWVYDTSGQDCRPGNGRLWGLRITTKSGLPAMDPGLILWNSTTGRFDAPVHYVDFGTGIPSAPVVTNGRIYLSSSIKADKITEFKIPSWGGVTVRSWREVFTK